jgi:hypothetical protein
MICFCTKKNDMLKGPAQKPIASPRWPMKKIGPGDQSYF